MNISMTTEFDLWLKNCGETWSTTWHNAIGWFEFCCFLLCEIDCMFPSILELFMSRLDAQWFIFLLSCNTCILLIIHIIFGMILFHFRKTRCLSVISNNTNNTSIPNINKPQSVMTPYIIEPFNIPNLSKMHWRSGESFYTNENRFNLGDQWPYDLAFHCVIKYIFGIVYFANRIINTINIHNGVFLKQLCVTFIAITIFVCIFLQLFYEIHKKKRIDTYFIGVVFLPRLIIFLKMFRIGITFGGITSNINKNINRSNWWILLIETIVILAHLGYILKQWSRFISDHTARGSNIYNSFDNIFLKCIYIFENVYHSIHFEFLLFYSLISIVSENMFYLLCDNVTGYLVIDLIKIWFDKDIFRWTLWVSLYFAYNFSLNRKLLELRILQATVDHYGFGGPGSLQTSIKGRLAYWFDKQRYSMFFTNLNQLVNV